MTETTAPAAPIKARRGDLVMVELRIRYTTSAYKREAELGYRLMMVSSLTRAGEIKMVRDNRYGEDGYPQKFDGMLYRTGKYWLLPAADWNPAVAQQIAAGNVYPNSTTPRDFLSLEAARTALAPARHGNRPV